MSYDAILKFIQAHFVEGLVVIIGSGLSAAEGLPGMPALGQFLREHASSLTGSDASTWALIQAALDSGEGLEAALLQHPPSDALQSWIAKMTCSLLLPEERRVMSEVLSGNRVLRLTTLLKQIRIPSGGLPILTTNYDRLIEVACELAGLHVDTTAIGHYAGAFDPNRSMMGSAKRVVSRGKMNFLEHYPRAVVLKPHGSFDWYRVGTDVRRCSLDLEGDRHIITPGVRKYRDGYEWPFDRHRELANKHINQAARLLVVGYGFNDDHLQVHLVKRIQDGTPTLILNRALNSTVRDLVTKSTKCVCLSAPSEASGVSILTTNDEFEKLGAELWDLGVLAKELLQ